MRQQLGQEDILDVIRRRQENWEYKLDMNSDRTIKKVYVGVMEGRRERGRPRMRWIDNLNDLCTYYDICFSRHMQICSPRDDLQ